MKIVLFSSFLLISLGLISIGSNQPIEGVQFLMGSYSRIEIYGGNRGDLDYAFKVLRRLDDLLSDYNPDSEISLINRAAGTKVFEASDEVVEILDKAVEIARLTNGAFDPTIGAITIGLYGFGRENSTIPDALSLKEATTLVDYRLIEIDGKKVYLKKKGMMLDLGGIGKGYAIDKAVEYLKRREVKSAFVSISGDIKVFGRNYNIGIQDPNNNGVIASFDTGDSDFSISTSGVYNRYIAENGEKAHHLLIPATGRSQKGIKSVTIVSKNGSTFTDGVATAIFILGKEDGIKFLDHRKNIGAFLIFDDNSIYINKAFNHLVNNLQLSRQ
ncbi:MAG: FAD:protein FMN transferase [Thermodesulfobacteriota bacterium]